MTFICIVPVGRPGVGELTGLPQATHSNMVQSLVLDPGLVLVPPPTA